MTKEDIEKLVETKISELAPASDSDNVSNLAATIVLAIFILSLFFLFYGEPDVWDVMREAVMENLTKDNCTRQ